MVGDQPRQLEAPPQRARSPAAGRAPGRPARTAARPRPGRPAAASAAAARPGRRAALDEGVGQRARAAAGGASARRRLRQRLGAERRQRVVQARAPGRPANGRCAGMVNQRGPGLLEEGAHAAASRSAAPRRRRSAAGSPTCIQKPSITAPCEPALGRLQPMPESGQVENVAVGSAVRSVAGRGCATPTLAKRRRRTSAPRRVGQPPGRRRMKKSLRAVEAEPWPRATSSSRRPSAPGPRPRSGPPAAGVAALEPDASRCWPRRSGRRPAGRGPA